MWYAVHFIILRLEISHLSANIIVLHGAKIMG